jgi:hypothetical protein
MEPVMGKITRELREGEEWWIVSDQAVELMSFETLWRAQEWRRTTPIYVHCETETGICYYMEEDKEWYFRTAGSRGWRKAENQQWVEDKVKEMQEKYLKNKKTPGFM